MSIILFSKPIHSGKTTELMHWCKVLKSCSGILMPDIDGQRKMYDIEKQLYFDAECNNSLFTDEQLIEIGNYSFYQSAFDNANQIIIEAILQKPTFIVIDEVGILEMGRKGFYTSVKQLINASNAGNINSKIILAVRDIFVTEVVACFNIINYKVVDTLNELYL